MRAKGKKVGLLRPLTIWPFPDELVKHYLSEVKGIIVPELNQGQLSLELKRVLGHRKTRKIVEVQKNTGELITPQEIINAMKEVH
jgi:2-oxoglutarate ferredoxin oxidoreductase subunit alpha